MENRKLFRTTLRPEFEKFKNVIFIRQSFIKKLQYRPPKTNHTLADFLSGECRYIIATNNRLVWGGSRQSTIKSDLAGGKLNMFDFQTS